MPSAGTRRAHAGDAATPTISTGFAPKDFDQLIKEGKVKVVGVPIPNCLWYVALNTSQAAVRQREAAAGGGLGDALRADPVGAFFGRAMPMYGGAATVEQRGVAAGLPLRHRSRQGQGADGGGGLRARASKRRSSLDVGTATVGEPTAVLIQESLGKIGIKVTIDKIPGANWRTTLNKKELPMALNRFSGWLDYPEYYFFWNFHGNNSIFNISAYKNPAMDALIDKARFTDDPAEYETAVKEFIALCMREVPVVPLNQPIHDVAMQKAIGGYEFWFHREPDFRQFTKA